ncbi:MAG: hypothetical protein H0U45_08135 [Tatlockia sp.]|jgi:peptidoglycan hydrolase-like protein with peptidoglycan-binding domain|nr:hypothetical protein [Tatlockia sp.]
MKPIQATVRRNDRGDNVINLQDALLLLLEKARFDLSDARRRELEEQLRAERDSQQYFDGTVKVVAIFQEQYRERFHMEINGEVDEPTAEALNKLLAESGAFEQANAEWIVRGQVIAADTAVNEIQVSIFDRDLLFRREGENAGQHLKTEVTKRNETRNEDGWFEITYSTEQYRSGDITRNGGSIPDLIFALSKDGQTLDKFKIYRLPDGEALREETIVSDEDLILGIQARKLEEVRILIDGDELRREASEYEKLWRAIELLLPIEAAADVTDAERERIVCGAGENLDEEKHRDVSFIVRETGFDYSLVNLFASACKLSAKPFNHSVSTVVLYGLARSDKHFTNLTALAVASASELKEALEQAIDKNFIPSLDRQTIESSINHILRTAPQEILNQVPFEGQPTFGERIDAALPDRAEQATMLRAYAENKGETVKFWEQLRDLPEFAERGKIERLQFALQIDVLTQSHVPLMKALQTEHNLTSTRQLLDFGEDQLRELLLRPDIGVPMNVPIDLPEQEAGNEELRRERQVDNYVAGVMGALQLALPTESVAKVLREVPATQIGDETTQTALNTFFVNATDEGMRSAGTHFDIRTTNIDNYLKELGEAVFNGVPEENRDKVISQVKRSQRLFNVSTDTETFKKLVGSGFDSARDIASIPQQTFLADFRDKLGEEEAKMIHSRSTNISTSTLHYYVILNDAINGVSPVGVKSLESNTQLDVQETIAKHIPNWQELFGSPELCECGHCQSVYSPAAYLVEILHFLEKSGKNANGFTPLDILIGKTDEATKKILVMGRRPDIAHLKLTCENTNTVLPYVDLVNEVLESLAIAYAAAKEENGRIDVDYNTIAAYDTADTTTPELKANPHYTNPDAYHTPDQPDVRARLDRVAYPVNLPYDHSLETARIYLEHLGAKLSVLLEKFGNDESGTRLAAETLGLSPSEYAVITAKNLDGADAEIGKNADELYGLVPELLPSLKTGDIGKSVAALKQILNTNGAALPLNLDPAKEVFDAATETVVKGFQQTQGLDQDATVKIGEWRALAATVSSFAEFILPNVRELLRRAQISYEELDKIVRMRFLNPEQNVFDVLERLRVPEAELLAFVQADFQNPGQGIIDALSVEGAELEDFTAWASEHFSGAAFEKLKKSFVLVAPTDDACNLDRMVLRRWDSAQPAIDVATWHKINRLIRLWRKLGWDLADLDIALIALQADDITPEVVEQLSLIRRVQEQFDLTVQQVVALWFTLDINRPDALYRKYFLSKAALKHDPAFKTDWKGDVLVGPGIKVKDHAPALLAAFRLKSDDLNALLPDETAPLTLESASEIARHTILARSLGVGITELIRLKELTGINNPFIKPTGDWALLRFTALAQLLQNVELSVPQLEYILKGKEDSSPEAPQKDVIERFIKDELKPGLEQVKKDFSVIVDPRGEITRARMMTLYDDAAVVNAFVQLLDGTADYSVKLNTLPGSITFPGNLAKRLRFDKHAKALFCRGALTNTELAQLAGLSGKPAYKAAINELGKKQQDILDQALSGTNTIKLSIPNAKDKLIDKSSFNSTGEADVEAIAEKFKFVLEKISPVLQDLEQRSLVKQKMAETFGAEITLIASLIDEDEQGKILLYCLDDNTQPLVEDFISPASLTKIRDAYVKLNKVVLLTATFQFKDAELASLNEMVDFNNLTFDVVEKLAQYFILKRQLPKSETLLADVFTASSKNKVIAVLADATGWSKELIGSLIDSEGLKWSLADLQDVGKLDLLRECMRLLNRLGIKAEQAFSWTRAAVEIEQSEDIKRVTKAKYDDDSWLKVAKPLSDSLRESQKNALIAYLLPRLRIENSNQLYEKLLIDVEMSPCMMTSRIKQAISSAQLFIQRCLMNLESQVLPSAIDTQQWKTMERAPFFMAKRQVFLYPENWIEPELRDDKTPFFKELESDILQNDVTDKNVEQALQNYLEKLDAVAKLQICGIFVQDDFEAQEKKKEVVHVFGRTANQPQSYYYRQYVVTSNDVTYWTPWEKVPVDVRGDQIAPVVWNRRLYLFWAIVSKKTEEPPVGTSAPQKGEPYDELQIAWSEYRNGKWSSKYVTEQSLRLTVKTPRLTAYTQINGTLVVVYEEAEYRAVSYPPGFNISTNEVTPARSVTEISRKANGRFLFDNCHAGLNLKVEKWSRNHTDGYSASPYDIQLLGDGSIQPLPTLNYNNDEGRLIEQQLRHSSHDYFIFEDNQRAYFVRLDAEANDGGISDMLYDKDLTGLYLNKTSEASPEKFDESADLGRPYFDTLAQTTAASNSWISANARIAALSLQKEPQMNFLGGTMTQPSQNLVEINKSILSLIPDYQVYKRAPDAKLTYETFYHPFVCEFIKSLERDGIPGVLTLDSQNLISSPVFESRYKPNPSHVAKPYPVERVDFGQINDSATYRTTAYSTYNWELFFHVPMLVATRLSNNQQFEDAIRWLQYVFNPTDGDGKYWKVLPFTKTPQENIDKLLKAINAKDDEMLKQLAEWRDHPFQPHLIARMRLSAYQKYVVMKMIDIVLACGDYYFRQDTIESINIALQYYVWCADMLGERPQKIPNRSASQPKTFAELRKNLDGFSNAMIDFENKFPTYSGTSLVPSQSSIGLLGMRRSFYFCIPQNDKLLGYWDMVRDRMFKIRHCMDIEGVVRELPLFEPPIDPALLVQAAARGISLSNVMNDLSASMPQHKFPYLLQKSIDSCSGLQSLGNTLLAALEKRDVEKLVVLRQQHEKVILDLVKNVREKQIEEADTAIEVLNQTRERAVERYLYFQKNLGVEDLTKPAPGARIPMKAFPNRVSSAGGAHLIEQEKNELDASHSARDWQVRAATTEILASLSFYIPTVTANAAPWGVGIDTVVAGGHNIGPALKAIADYQRNLGAKDAYNASHAGKMAGYVRREMGDILQANDAACEIMQIDKQILAARIRVEITKQELVNHEKQIKNAEVIEEFLTSKYTNEDLYAWIEGKASQLYFQYFQLASDWAKKAERSFRFNLGLTTSNFIKPGAWDSLRKGLMAGEALSLQLRQMDLAYHDQNKREYEISKHISLMQINPMALIELRQNGVCEFELPEFLFDFDFPGHYFRRIKSVSVSVPCIIGPYTGVSGTLTLLNNRIRFQNITKDYPEKFDEDDDRFIRDYIPLQSIATSTGQNDSGLFELNFRDERYLPFEGGGVISRWRFELPTEFRQFDYNTISDVVLHVKYTSREGGEQLKAEVNEAISNMFENEEQKSLARMFSLRHEFSTEWNKFLNHAEANGDHIQAFSLVKERFPFLFQNKKYNLKLYQVGLIAVPKSEEKDLDLTSLKLDKLKPNSNETNLITDEIKLKGAEKIGNLAYCVGSFDGMEISSDSKKSKCLLTIKKEGVEDTLKQIEDIWLVCHYTVSG